MANILKTLAFADDDPAILEAFKSACNQYEIAGTARNGLEAIQLVTKAKPQVLVMDLHMPHLDGLEALKQISQLGTTAVVIVTADSDPAKALEAMDAGASGFITKPFEVSQILTAIETAWHRFSSEHVLRTQILDLQNNLETRKLLEKAKGILMEQQGMSEDMAHRTLQKMSQDQAISLKEVCRSLIQVRALLGKAKQRKVA